MSGLIGRFLRRYHRSGPRSQQIDVTGADELLIGISEVEIDHRRIIGLLVDVHHVHPIGAIISDGVIGAELVLVGREKLLERLLLGLGVAEFSLVIDGPVAIETVALFLAPTAVVLGRDPRHDQVVEDGRVGAPHLRVDGAGVDDVAFHLLQRREEQSLLVVIALARVRDRVEQLLDGGRCAQFCQS